MGQSPEKWVFSETEKCCLGKRLKINSEKMRRQQKEEVPWRTGKFPYGVVCENLVGLSTYKGHMEIAEYTWVNECNYAISLHAVDLLVKIAKYEIL